MERMLAFAGKSSLLGWPTSVRGHVFVPFVHKIQRTVSLGGRIWETNLIEHIIPIPVVALAVIIHTKLAAELTT